MNVRMSYGALVCMLLLLPACLSSSGKKDKNGIDWTVSLEHTKKTPYGSSIAYETLPRYFPSARQEQLTRWFRYTSIDDHMYGGMDSASLLVLLGLDCFVTDEEWMSLLRFARAGNEIFLLSSNIDAHIAEAMHLDKVSGGREEYPLSQYNDGTSSQKALRLIPDSTATYGHRGRPLTAYFEIHHQYEKDTLAENYDDADNSYDRKQLEEEIDTTPVVLGSAQHQPNFLRFRVGQGHVTLHAAPLVLSNYFLLQKGNRTYLDSIWHAFPANISTVYWNEYYRRTTESSSLSVLFKYPATRWALIIAASALLLYVLFGLKRLQRIVPPVAEVTNTTVSFVETVGQLYYHKGVHANLAEKMVQHFLEWVRTYYYLDTTQLGDTFIQQLTSKSGKPVEEVSALVARIHEIRLGSPVSSEYLYDLHRSIQSFYNAH